MNRPPSAPDRHRAFKFIFVPLLILSLLVQCAVVWTQLEDIRKGYMDFVLYYCGAQIINDGNGAKLYELQLQREYQKPYGSGDKDFDLPFNHLPYQLLPLLIPARFSFPVAHAIWTVLNILLLVVIWIRLSAFVQAGHRLMFGLVLLAFFPTITALRMGQDSIITAFLLAETFVSLKSKRYAIAGALLALGLYKPQFVLPLFRILLLHGRGWATVGFVCNALLLGLTSMAMVGWDGLMGLVSLWLTMIQRGHVVWPERMMNLRGMVYVILDLAGLPTATNLVTLALSVLVYVITLRLWPRTVDERDELFDLRFALALIMTALVSFHSYAYDGTFLAIPIIIMLNQVLKAPDPYPARYRIFLLIVIELFLPFVPNVLMSTSLLSWWALSLTVFFAVMAVEILRRSTPAPLSAPAEH